MKIEIDTMLIKPLWFIEDKTLVAILQVIKNLNEDITRKIITVITLQKSEEDYYTYEINYNYNEVVIDDMKTSDYYFSE